MTTSKINGQGAYRMQSMPYSRMAAGYRPDGRPVVSVIDGTGVEDYEIVFLQRGQRFLTTDELRELALKKRNYALEVELKRAKGILWRFMVAVEWSAPAWLRLTLQALSGEAAKFLAESAMRMDNTGRATDAEVP